jgi:hypothetical protein
MATIMEMTNEKGDKDQICFIPALLKVVYTAPTTTVSKGLLRGKPGDTIDANYSYSNTVVTVEELFKTGKINLTNKGVVIGAIGKEVIQPSNLKNLSTNDKTFIQALNADADNVFHGGGSKKGVRGTRRKRKKDAK